MTVMHKEKTDSAGDVGTTRGEVECISQKWRPPHQPNREGKLEDKRRREQLHQTGKEYKNDFRGKVMRSGAASTKLLRRCSGSRTSFSDVACVARTGGMLATGGYFRAVRRSPNLMLDSARAVNSIGRRPSSREGPLISGFGCWRGWESCLVGICRSQVAFQEQAAREKFCPRED